MSGGMRKQSAILCVAAVAAVAVACAAAGEAEQRWDVAGKFLSLKAGQADVAVFEVADATRVEIPLAALSEANRRAIAELTKDAASSGEAPNKGDDGASTAENDKTSERVSHAIGLLRLGNQPLAKQELQKASKADPSRGEADFVMGIVYALGARNYEKAVDHFAEAVSREPDNAAALANLALCELHAKQYSNAVSHFRRALELKPDGQAIADNIALAIQAAGAGRARMTEKVLADLNDVYRKALTDLKLSRLDPEAGLALVFHGLDGRPVDPKSPSMILDAVKRPAGKTSGEPILRESVESSVKPGEISAPAKPQ